MGYFSGTYACGHEGKVQIYGPSKDREWKAEREFSQLCRACYIAQQQKIAQENAQALNLPALQGSEKQVAWAMQLRDRLLTAYNKETIPAQSASAMRYVINHMTRKQTDASWWIDRRDNVGNLLAMIRRYMDENPEVGKEARERITQ